MLKELAGWILLFTAGMLALLFFAPYRIAAVIFFVIFLAMALTNKTKIEFEGKNLGTFRLVDFMSSILGAVLRAIVWPVFLICR